MLRGRNQRYQTIKFVDIAAPDYSAEANAGVEFETAMGRIHAIQMDGTILTNVQVPSLTRPPPSPRGFTQTWSRRPSASSTKWWGWGGSTPSRTTNL